LHANAVDGNPSVKGASTYIMGMDKNENNLREAMRENSVMKLEEDYTEKYEGFNPTSAESYIIFSLKQFAEFDRSLQLAIAIQRRYKTDTYFVDRGAKQGPFYVLWKAAMPRVLTEMGFISNDGDRRYMNSERGQNSIARAIFDAFSEYLHSVTVARQAVKLDVAAAQPAPASVEKNSTTGFYVQLCASRGKVQADDARFASHSADLVEKSIGGWYKYYFGGYSSLEDAVRVRDEVRREGIFPDAFVIALDGDRQITIDEAKQRIKN
jgi:N-acetylmuramoyl-L-alanine amidase